MVGDTHQNDSRDNTGLVHMHDESYEEGNTTRQRILNNADDFDLGAEGNKSTYLRPSRNRDMSSLLEGKSHSLSYLGTSNTQPAEPIQETSQPAIEVAKPKKGVILPKLKLEEALRVQRED